MFYVIYMYVVYCSFDSFFSYQIKLILSLAETPQYDLTSPNFLMKLSTYYVVIHWLRSAKLCLLESCFSLSYSYCWYHRTKHDIVFSREYLYSSLTSLWFHKCNTALTIVVDLNLLFWYVSATHVKNLCSHGIIQFGCYLIKVEWLCQLMSDDYKVSWLSPWSQIWRVPLSPG